MTGRACLDDRPCCDMPHLNGLAFFRRRRFRFRLLRILSATLLLLSCAFDAAFAFASCAFFRPRYFHFRLLRFLSATLPSLSPLAHSFGDAAFAFASSAFFRRVTLFSLSPPAHSFGGRRCFYFRL